MIYMPIDFLKKKFFTQKKCAKCVIDIFICVCNGLYLHTLFLKCFQSVRSVLKVCDLTHALIDSGGHGAARQHDRHQGRPQNGDSSPPLVMMISDRRGDVLKVSYSERHGPI